MLGGADNPNGELPSYITGANTVQTGQVSGNYPHAGIMTFHPILNASVD